MRTVGDTKKIRNLPLLMRKGNSRKKVYSFFYVTNFTIAFIVLIASIVVNVEHQLILILRNFDRISLGSS